MAKLPASLFNDVIGPVMRGPSSSHVAGAARIGALVRQSLGGDVRSVLVEFDVNGSLAESYHGHGSDIGFVSGLLDIDLTDPRVPDACAIAEREGVEIRCYDVIYKCLEELDAARIGMLKPTEVEVSTGTATVLDTFKVPKVGIAAGVRVEEGEIAATDSVRLVRDGIVVFNGKIASMRHYKDEAKSLKSGSEGGIGLENFQDIKPGDTIEGYRIDQVARTE